MTARFQGRAVRNKTRRTADMARLVLSRSGLTDQASSEVESLLENRKQDSEKSSYAVLELLLILGEKAKRSTTLLTTSL